jgi:hypothetical protein
MLIQQVSLQLENGIHFDNIGLRNVAINIELPIFALTV